MYIKSKKTFNNRLMNDDVDKIYFDGLEYPEMCIDAKFADWGTTYVDTRSQEYISEKEAFDYEISTMKDNDYYDGSKP